MIIDNSYCPRNETLRVISAITRMVCCIFLNYKEHIMLHFFFHNNSYGLQNIK